jgi:hypothetical protein
MANDFETMLEANKAFATDKFGPDARVVISIATVEGEYLVPHYTGTDLSMSQLTALLIGLATHHAGAGPGAADITDCAGNA